MLGEVRVVGHPFGPLGTSRAARCSLASFHAVGVPARVLDIWKTSTRESLHARTIGPHVVHDFGRFNVFHVNGDEIAAALDRLGGLPAQAVNVVYPMWELPRYPAAWVPELERFNEVWAASTFIAESIAPAVSIPVVHLPLATQVTPVSLRSRRYFGIPESHYAFLFFFDLRSFAERKNPSAVIDAFERFLTARPWASASLVVKVHGSANAPDAAAQLQERVRTFDRRVVLIDRLMDEDEVHALIYNCDAFVSLHRSEGYGLGLAEAMALGKPAIATGWSGNLEFMNSTVAYVVPHRLIPVAADAYPGWSDQVWAEPDIEYASEVMTTLYDDPDAGRRMGRKASQHMRCSYSFRAAGLRYLSRMVSLLSTADHSGETAHPV